MTTARHPTELTWARALAGELGFLARARLRRHLAACDACRRLEAELAAERRAFDADPRRAEELRRLRARAGAARTGGDGAPGLRGFVLVAGAAAVVLVAGVAVVETRRPGPELAVKGDVLQLVVDGAAGSRPVEGRCAAGDRIMGRYRTARRYLLLLERDGAGRVQTLVPRDGAASLRLDAGEGVTPESFVLDATPGRECFVAVFSDAPVAAAEAARAVRARPDAPAIPGAAVQVRCCDKDGTR